MRTPMRIIMRMMEMQQIPCQSEGVDRSPRCARVHVVSMAVRPDEGAEFVEMLIRAALDSRWTIIDNRLCCPACTAHHEARSIHRPQMGAV